MPLSNLTSAALLALSQHVTGSKAWGEVAPAAGGVIIPYLGTIDLTGVRLGQGSSFGYSDCLKWGYDGSIMVAAFNATQAVGILGLDLTRVSNGTLQPANCSTMAIMILHKLKLMH